MTEMTEIQQILRESFYSGPYITLNGYKYFVNPIGDGIPPITPKVLRAAVEGLMKVCKFDCDLIVAPEAMGIPLATGISLQTQLPFAIIRKRRYDLPGEIVVNRSTGYVNNNVFINGILPGTRVTIVDDIIDTGGTMRAIVDALRAHGVIVSEVGAVYSKATDIDGILPGVDVKILLHL